jgi:hypothetical protein
MTRNVTVQGGDDLVSAELAATLPHSWRVSRRGFADAIVLVRPSSERVRRTRAEYPATPILVLMDAAAPASDVVVLLDAGANACVRDTRPDLIGDELRVINGNRPRRLVGAA